VTYITALKKISYCLSVPELLSIETFSRAIIFFYDQPVASKAFIYGGLGTSVNAFRHIAKLLI
jgi:hypothetical protein